MTEAILDDAAHIISDRGASIEEMIQDRLQTRGRTHAVIEYHDELFSLRGKEYRYQGNSSFGVDQVEHADNKDHTLLSYIQQMDAFFVFDAQYVLEQGSVYTQPSKKSKQRNWIEVDSSAGAPLPDYIAERASPDTLAGDNATLASF
jgi:hypothetical protein